MFVIDPSLSTDVAWPKKGCWPKLLCEVMDYDMTSKDDGMGNANFDLSKLHPVREGVPLLKFSSVYTHILSLS